VVDYQVDLPTVAGSRAGLRMAVGFLGDRLLTILPPMAADYQVGLQMALMSLESPQMVLLLYWAPIPALI
jgi:hypothetical protein